MMSFVEVSEQLVGTLVLGSKYAMVALGLAVVFSVLGLINFAHGELVVVAAYVAAAATARGVGWEVTLPTVIVLTVLVAVVLERVAFRPVRNARPATLLVTSLAASFILQNILLL